MSTRADLDCTLNKMAHPAKQLQDTHDYTAHCVKLQPRLILNPCMDRGVGTAQTCHHRPACLKICPCRSCAAYSSCYHPPLQPPHHCDACTQMDMSLVLVPTLHAGCSHQQMWLQCTDHNNCNSFANLQMVDCTAEQVSMFK